jgi:hypothetical protein
MCTEPGSTKVQHAWAVYCSTTDGVQKVSKMYSIRPDLLPSLVLGSMCQYHCREELYASASNGQGVSRTTDSLQTIDLALGRIDMNTGSSTYHMNLVKRLLISNIKKFVATRRIEI